MEGLKDIRYEVRDGVGIITLNRPRYRNAQSHALLDEVDRAFDAALADDTVRVVIVRGADGVFSAGHDLSEDEARRRAAAGPDDPLAAYDRFKKYNLDLLLKWRDFPKPTIAMVEGYCIYAGWMLAASMDVVFASEDALFLAGFVEYMSIPWDLGIRRAKELCFESRFITAREGAEYGFVNRVLPAAELERETMAYARRVAENDPFTLRMTKLQMNKAQDAQGFRNAVEDGLGDWVAMMNMPQHSLRSPDGKSLAAVALAVRGRKGERYGLNGG